MQAQETLFYSIPVITGNNVNPFPLCSLGMNSVERVAIRTRELRLKHGLTQQELAEVADFSEKFLQQIEARRKKEIWLSTVERLAAAFSLELHEFLDPSTPNKSKLAKKVISSRVHK